MTDIDLAAVMAAHEGKHKCSGWLHNPMLQTWNPLTGAVGPLTGPCEPYRLAEALTASEAKVARVEAFAQTYAISAHALGRRDEERGWLDLLIVLERLALADQPEQAR